MVFGTTFSSQNLISETNKGNLILKIDEGFYQFIKDPSNYGEINIDGSQNIKIYPGLGITDICAIDLFIANRSSNMFSNETGNCLQRDLSDIDFISYTCLSENTIYDISLDNSFVEITIEYKANKLNKLNNIQTNDANVNRNSSKLKFFNNPKNFNNALKRTDNSKYLITPELNDEYNIPGRDLSGHFNNLIYYKSSNNEGDISTSLYIDDTSAEILTPVQLLNYKLLEIQEEAIKEDPGKNVFFNTKNWGNYTHPLSGFHLGALAYNNLLYNDLSYDNNVFYNENSGNYFDEQTYRKLTIPHMANKYVKRINDISLISNGLYDNIYFPYTEPTLGGDINHDVEKNIFPDLSLIYNSEFNLKQNNKEVSYEDKNLLFNIDNVWQHICDICFTDITYLPTTAVGDNTADISYFYNEISKNFFNIFNEDKTSTQSSNFIIWDGSDFSCIKTKLGLPDDSIGRDCEIKIEYFYELYNTMGGTMEKRQMNYFFKGYDLSSCFGFFNSEHNQNIFRNITISGNSYDMSYIFNIGGDILSEPGLMESTMSPPINIESPPSNLDYYDLCGGKIKYKKKYGYTLSNFNINKSEIHISTLTNSNITSVNSKKIIDDNFNNGLWSFYTNNVRYTTSDSNESLKIYNSILKNKIINTYISSDTSVCDLRIKDILHSSYKKYLKYMDKNFFSFNKWINLKKEFSTTEIDSIFNDNSIFNENDYFLKTKLDFSNISILTVDDLFEKKAFVNKAFYNGEASSVSLRTNRKDMYKSEPSDGVNINGSKSFSIHEPVQYHTIDDYINDISYSLSDSNKPLLSHLLITKYFSGGIYLIFRYIDFINQGNIMSKSKKVTTNDAYDYEIFPFISLGYNFNFRTKKYQLQVTSDNYGIESFNNEKFPKLRVYARKARQDINTKKLLNIEEFDKIPLFLYKDPFVNNHHQFEITSKTIPTMYPALTCDVSSIYGIDNSNRLYNKKSLEEIYLTVNFTNSTNNLNNRFLSNFKTQLNKNNELLYFAQQNKNNPPIKFKIRNSNYDDYAYNLGNSYNIVNGQYSSIINDLFLYNLPRWQYRPIYETINTNILSILNCNNNPDFSTNFGNKHFENLLAINNNKLPKLNEEKYNYKLIYYFNNIIYNLNKIYKYDIIDLSSYSYLQEIQLSSNLTNVLEAFNDICTNYYDMSLINYMNNKNSRIIGKFPLYQNINIKIAKSDYITNTDYKLDLQLWDVSNMFIDLSNKYQIDFSNINCKGSNIFHLTEDISINNDWNYIYSEKLLRSRDFSFSTSDSIIDLSFSINITELSDSNLSMTNLNYLDLSYNLYDSITTKTNESISNRFVLNFNYLTSRDNSENFNYYCNNVKNLNIIDNQDRNLLENYNNDNLNNFNMKMFDFETLHPKIHSNIINDNSKIDICPEAFLNCDLFFENNFNLYDESYNYYKINNTKDSQYLDMSNSKLNISELFEYKMFSSSNLIEDISKSIETFNFTPFTKKFINDISFYFSDNINYIYSNKYSPLNINIVNDLIPNVNLIDNNKLVYKNTILLSKDASNLFADLNIDKINCLMNFTKTDNCDKMFKNTLSLYDNRLLKFSAFNNFNNDILLNEMFMNSSINYFPYLLINSLKNCPNTSKIEAKDIITNCDNMYLNEYFLAIRSFSEVLDFDNNLKYTDSNITNVEISWNLTNNKYFGGAYPLNYYFGPENNPSKFKDYTINKTPHLLTMCDSEKGIYWDYYIDTGNSLNCINKLNKDVLLPNTNNSSVSRLLSGFGSRGFKIMTNEVWQYQDFSLNIYKKKEYGGFQLLGYNKNSTQYIGGDLYWSIGFLLKILGFTDLSNQTHYNKPISLNSKYEQRRKFLKEKMYKHNNSDQILDWYGVDDICCGQPITNRDSYSDYSLNQVNLFNLFPETSYCWLDLSVNLSYHDIYNENNYIDKTVKPNMNLNIMKNEPFYRTDTLYDFPSKIHYANEYLNLSWLERFTVNQLNTGYKFNDSPVFRYIYVNSFSTPILRANKYSVNTIIKTQISDIMINVKVNNSDQSFVLIDNSICELFDLSFGNMFYDTNYEKPWFNDSSGIYTSIGNDRLTDNSLKGYKSKKFPFYHITSKNISDSNNNNNLKNACLDRLQKGDNNNIFDKNYNFWLKIDLGFILNKLYPNDFTSQSIPLDRINYIYFYENQISDNLTYILSNINYSSQLEQSENLDFSYKNNLLQPGFLSAHQYTINSFDMGLRYYDINNAPIYNNNNLNDGIFYEEEHIYNNTSANNTILYNYKVFNCNELNLFTYTNGFKKDFNQEPSSVPANWKTVIDFDYFKTQVAVDSNNYSVIPTSEKNGILIKGNTDFNYEKIYTEISNNIASFSNFKNGVNTLSNLEDVSNNTIRFDYTPYQNRNDYETREITNYFIENYHNLIKKSVENEILQ